MAWENNSGRNGNYTVLKSFQVHDTCVIVDGHKPRAAFDARDTVRVEHTGESLYDGPMFTIQKLVTDRARATINRRSLEDLIEAVAVKKL